MKIAIVDAGLFTAPYDRALMDGLAFAGDEARLYGKYLPPDDLLNQDRQVVQHFYRPLLHPSATRLPLQLLQVVKGVLHIYDMGALVKALRRWRPDIIHFQWLPVPLIDRAFLAALRQVAPLVCTVHDSNPYNGHRSAWLQRAGWFSVLQEFSAVIVHTGQSQARLVEQGVPADKIVKIAHGLLHEGAAGLKGLDGPEVKDGATLDVLLFGKIKPYKGADVLIRAVGQLSPKERSEIRVRIVGKPYMETGPLLDMATALGVRDRFVFDFRFIDDDELPQIFGPASVVVFPYREIDASGVLMTALTAARPIVATRIGIFGELLTDGSDALVIPPDDPKALAGALSRLLADRALRQSLGAGAKRLAESIPSWADIGQATHRVYERIIARNLPNDLAA